MLQLAGEAFAAGELRSSDDPELLRWQSPSFTRPFDFVLGAVKGVRFPAPAGPAKPEGEYCFELAGDDVLFGSLMRLSEDEVELEVPRFGRLHARRDHLLSLYRWNLAELIYLGPHGLAGWKEPANLKQWNEELGRPLTDQPGAALYGDLGIPPQAVIDFELSWKAKPDFTLALGVGEDAGTMGRGFRLEVYWRPPSAASIIVPDAHNGEPAEWEYTFRNPGERWFDPGFKPEGWQNGRGGFGTRGTPGAIVRTEWNTNEIWMRRKFEVKGSPKSLALSIHHDEDAQVWINGEQVFAEEGFLSAYGVVPLDRAVKVLQEGQNTLAVHCRQTGGGQYIDVGLLEQGGGAGDLVAVRETEREAEVASVGQVVAGPGRTHLVAYLDQERGRLLIFTPDGARVTALEAAPTGPQVSGGLQLMNHGGDLRLERLRISRWNGVPPGDAPVKVPRLQLRDGSAVYGQPVGVDSGTKEFIVRGEEASASPPQEGAGEIRVPAAQVASVVLSPAIDGPPRSFRAVYRDGTQLSGKLTRLDRDHLELDSPGIKGTLRLPLSGMRSFVVLGESKEFPARSEGSPARLEMEGLSLSGRLLDGREGPGESCLVWQPDLSRTASPLRPGASGRISFRQGSPPPRPQPASRFVSALRAISGLFGQNASPTAAAGRRSLYLRNGDAVPCQVSRIDENGISFQTPLSDATFVGHDKVKAAELTFVEGPPRLNKGKRDRLLMLPRMQAPSPPTHLVCSRGGDFLRGRLIALEDKVLRMEIRSEEKEIDRNLISHIIWLHADELTEPAPSKAGPPEAQPGTRLQARLSDGNRMTFLPQKLEGDTLTGRSEVLGTCRVDLKQVERILIGGEVKAGAVASDLAYQRWKLHHAIQPVYLQVLDGPKPAGPTPGTDSALVGKPAPDFELDLLDGKKFRLANSRGRVVILDFWATWCGPCLQSLPQVDRVIRELKDNRVELIAVNLEEPPNLVASTLERHKLELTVALDRDGVVAAKYEAMAIPQSVVIDREGKVARLFIGGGPQLADQLRDAVRDLLPPVQE